jgi:hypothetical protein
MTNYGRVGGEYLWLIGVDTPMGIHCCYGGCSSGVIDLGCDCDENKDVRIKAINRLNELKILPGEGIPLATRIMRMWLNSLSPMDDHDFFNVILEHGKKIIAPPF